MSCPSSLRFGAKPRQLPYVYIYTYMYTYIYREREIRCDIMYVHIYIYVDNMGYYIYGDIIYYVIWELDKNLNDIDINVDL